MKSSGIIAACDTDGAHIVATEKAGTVYVETRGADFYEGGAAEPANALSYAEVDEIAVLFEPLNPFDRTLLPGSPLRVKGASEGLFISAKRYALVGSDGDFIDRKESILGMLFAPFDGWIDEAWRTIGEMWDFRPPARRPWFALPALRCLSLTSPACSREMKALAGMRPWNSFLVASVLGTKSEEPELRTAVAVAPLEPDPKKWAALDWRFGETGKPVPLGRPDSQGVRWRLRTLERFLSDYVKHPIAEMLAPDGSPCRAYTRGILRPRPVRDGERWLILKEATVWGDDPRHAFSVPDPEGVVAVRSVPTPNGRSKSGLRSWRLARRPWRKRWEWQNAPRGHGREASASPQIRTKSPGRSLPSQRRLGLACRTTNISGRRRSAASCPAAPLPCNASLWSQLRCWPNATAEFVPLLAPLPPKMGATMNRPCAGGFPSIRENLGRSLS
jgi:hypothetical protein